MKKIRSSQFITSILLLILGGAQQFFINYSIYLSLLVILSCLFFSYYNERKWQKYILFTLSAVNVIGLLFTNWLLFNFLGWLSIVVGIIFFISSLMRSQSYLKRTSKLILTLLICIPIGFITLVSFQPDVVFHYVRENLMETTNVTSAAQKNLTLKDGTRVIKDVQYDDQVANGYLDIYHSEHAASKKPLTIFYIHGGGYIWGDKASGDPNAGQSDFKSTAISNFLEMGYNVVSFNYALSPEYKYPVAIKQLNRGLAYIKENAAEFELNMDNVVLSGASAGGNLAGVLANIQTNPVYAALVDEKAVFSNEQLKGVVLEGGLVDNRQFGNTHNVLIDWIFYNMGRVYLSTNDLQTDAIVKESNVMDFVTESFPATFISDGNSGTFFDQAFVLNARLIELGVDTELNYFPKNSYGPLGHGFEESGNEAAQITMEHMERFLENISEE